MRMSTVFLLITALASAGVSAGLWLELRAERALNAELSERLSLAIATPIAAPPPVAQGPAAPVITTAPVAAPAAPAPVIVATTVEPETAKPARNGPRDWQARQRKLMDDPKYREAFREQQRLRLATRRDNFIRLLGFSPEQADAVIELSIDQQLEMQQGMNDANVRAHEARLREVLGEEKSVQLQAYMESRQSRMQVDRFRTQLTGADMLRDDQVEPLISAMHAEQAQMQKELGEYRETLSWEGDATASSRQYAERQLEMMKAANRRVHSAASGILSGSQLERLDAMLKRDVERHEAQQRMSRIQSKLDQSGGAGTSPN